MTMAPARGIMVSIFHLPCVCRTLVPEIRIRSEMLRVFRYIDMLTCMVYSCQLSIDDDRSYSLSAMKISNED